VEARALPSLLSVRALRAEDGPSLRLGGELRGGQKLQVLSAVFGTTSLPLYHYGLETTILFPFETSIETHLPCSSNRKSPPSQF
jgi:hypothetical protein